MADKTNGAASRPALITAYVEAPKILDRCVLNEYPPGLIDWRPPVEGAWTVREHLVHIADADIHAFARIGHAIVESGLTLTNWDQEAWCETFAYCQQSATVALQVIRLIRSMIATRLKGLSAERWENARCIHPVRGELSLNDLLEIYTKHIGAHNEFLVRNEALWRDASPAEQARAQACR